MVICQDQDQAQLHMLKPKLQFSLQQQPATPRLTTDRLLHLAIIHRRTYRVQLHTLPLCSLEMIKKTLHAPFHLRIWPVDHLPPGLSYLWLRRKSRLVSPSLLCMYQTVHRLLFKKLVKTITKKAAAIERRHRHCLRTMFADQVWSWFTCHNHRMRRWLCKWLFSKWIFIAKPVWKADLIKWTCSTGRYWLTCKPAFFSFSRLPHCSIFKISIKSWIN